MANRMKGSVPKTPIRALMLLVLGAVAYQGAASAVGAAAKEPQQKIEAAVMANAARGDTTFWVLLREEANLAPALRMNGDDRGAFVYDRLRAVADASQADLRADLDGRGVDYKSFWIVNAIRVTGGEGLLLDIAARPEVKAIVADRALHIPPLQPGSEEPRVDTIEWNIVRIGAPKVWNDLNVRGEGIVVANIDTGVQFNHPALVQQYRGNLGGGNFDHNYNWADPSNVCGNPSNVPCDNHNHGTHTMGTMVGDDGNPGPNQIGVAPHAKWIACKGCETGTSCSNFALLSCGQWILAPTDLQGNNPNPALRPHVVNNSWGGPGGDPFYQAIVNGWVASGIFPQFSGQNAGPACRSHGSPGDYVNSYSAGAFDMSNNIARFSDRGPSAFGGAIKPNIAAPGVNVRSSVSNPPNSYARDSGTSMASPHVAGTVALIWSQSPSVTRDIAATRALLDLTALDVSDLTCGGTAADNNVWGEGRLDAFAAVRPPQLCMKFQRPSCDGIQVHRVSGGELKAMWWHYDCAHNTPFTKGRVGEERVIRNPCSGGPGRAGLVCENCAGFGDYYFVVDQLDLSIDMLAGIYPGGTCIIDDLKYELSLGGCVE